MPINDPTPMSMTDPTMAFAIPLPGSPIGFGVFTRKLRLKARMPPARIEPRITNSAPIAKTAHDPVSTVIVLLSSLRRGRLFMTASPRPAGDTPHQQPRKHVDDKCHYKQDQSELDQRLQIDLCGGLGKLVGNGRCDRERRGQ